MAPIRATFASSGGRPFQIDSNGEMRRGSDARQDGFGECHARLLRREGHGGQCDDQCTSPPHGIDELLGGSRTDTPAQGGDDDDELHGRRHRFDSIHMEPETLFSELRQRGTAGVISLGTETDAMGPVTPLETSWISVHDHQVHAVRAIAMSVGRPCRANATDAHDQDARRSLHDASCTRRVDESNPRSQAADVSEVSPPGISRPSIVRFERKDPVIRFDRRLEFGEVAAIEVSEVVQHGDALRGQLQHAQQQALRCTEIMFQHQLLRLIELADLLHREVIRVLEWEIAHNPLW